MFAGFLLLLVAVEHCIIEAASRNETEFKVCATCIKFNNVCHNVTHLLDLDAPFRKHIVIHNMVILRSKNILFYNFEPDIDDPEYSKIAFVNLDNPNITGIIEDGIRNFGPFDIDEANGVIYMSGGNDIYTLNTKDNTIALYEPLEDDVASLVYKGSVYFVLQDQIRNIQRKNDKVKTVLDDTSVKNFVINNNFTIVYLSRLGLFAARGNETVRLSKNPFFRGLTQDLDSVIYAWYIDGIYRVTIDDDLWLSRIEMVADLPGIGAMTFDNTNNVLLNIDRQLYRLRTTLTNKIC